MKFYKIQLTADGGESAGYQWETSEVRATSAAATWRRNSPGEGQTHAAHIETVEIDPTKTGILAALRRFASHPDNG